MQEMLKLNLVPETLILTIRMPTEDYSNTTRIARLRQIGDLKGLNKVARALDNTTQLSMKLGGVKRIIKVPVGLGSDCGKCVTNTTSCIGTFPLFGEKGQPPDSVVCDGSSCYLVSDPTITGLQINAIPGTGYTLSNYSGIVFIVNCTPTRVNYTTSSPGLTLRATQQFYISPGQVIKLDLSNASNTYTFTCSPGNLFTQLTMTSDGNYNIFMVTWDGLVGATSYTVTATDNGGYIPTIVYNPSSNLLSATISYLNGGPSQTITITAITPCGNTSVDLGIFN